MPPRIPTPAVARAVEPQLGVTQQMAGFSSTPSRDGFSKIRRDFRQWLKVEGSRYKSMPKEGEAGPRYLTSFYMRRRMGPEYVETSNPFISNPSFKVARVLNERARELVWQKVMHDGETIKAVAAEYGIDIRRVAAVIRLKEVEKDWEKKGKPLAKPYAKAVLSMVKTHNINANFQNQPLEDINEVHIHPHTMQQIFWPTSESTRVTRKIAAKVFSNGMLPLNKRVQIPELIRLERDIATGTAPHEAAQKFKDSVRASELKTAEKARAVAAAAAAAVTRVHTPRFDLRFQDFNAETVGNDGRRRTAIGARYGVPHYDRAKGQVKIPTSVP